MNIDILEVNRNDITCEMEFNIVDIDTNEVVGYLFTARVLEEIHIAYEVWECHRGNNIATDALKMITKRVQHPVLEITHNNIASKKVALKAGYTLVKAGRYFDIYEVSNKKKIKQFIR